MIMKKRIRNSLTYDFQVDSISEVPHGESLTVPDMTMSLQTLVKRYTRSGQIGEVPIFEGVYDGDVEIPHWERMTPQEKLDYARGLKESIASARAQLTKRNKEANAMQKEAEAQINENASESVPNAEADNAATE